MRSRPLLILRLNTAPTQDIGPGPHGRRVTFPITGGSFEGDRLRGKVLPGGSDWTVKRSDGVTELAFDLPVGDADPGWEPYLDAVALREGRADVVRALAAQERDAQI